MHFITKVEDAESIMELRQMAQTKTVDRDRHARSVKAKALVIANMTADDRISLVMMGLHRQVQGSDSISITNQRIVMAAEIAGDLVADIL